MLGPKKIVCLTEESAEILYELGESERIVGVSAYACRPKEIAEKPVVTAFVSGHIKKMLDLEAELFIGYSDIQKDLARDLIAAGQNVFISNHRSIEEIIEYIGLISRIVDKGREGLKLQNRCLENLKSCKNLIENRPKVYIEEWDDPMISGIEYFSELVRRCGGDPIFHDLSKSKGAMDRVVKEESIRELDPDIILACWCGKKVEIDQIESRKGWSEISAIRNNQIFELPPEIFLQPGPALLLDGPRILSQIFLAWEKNHS